MGWMLIQSTQAAVPPECFSGKFLMILVLATMVWVSMALGQSHLSLAIQRSRL